ncbi:MAG: PepSY domain-containing protein [Alphaproteobacteria bacterium]|nr:PepSY domain-containing protein [Alphaproteobacteria bacterium]
MNKALLFRLHRWTTLLFALPLAALIVTGLILSVEPLVVTGATGPGVLDGARITGILAQQDPEGRARGIMLRRYADEMVITGLPGGARIVALSTGERRDGAGALPALFGTSRSVHEHLVQGLDWLVVPSTVAMLVLIGLGLAMGLPTLRNTVGGWHKATGWFLMPLLIASPLTGLMLAWNITFADVGGTPAAVGAAGRVSIAQAAAAVAAVHDEKNLLWIRSRGNTPIARVIVDGEYRVFAVTGAGLQPQPRNWPRLIHEGVWGGALPALLNVAVSIAFAGLLGTGLFMWARRKLRRRSRATIPRPA